jgi:hypothetical protein
MMLFQVRVLFSIKLLVIAFTRTMTYPTSSEAISYQKRTIRDLLQKQTAADNYNLSSSFFQNSYNNLD